MAKKTKKEKILAEYRRKIQTEQKTAVLSATSISHESKTDYSYVLSDLSRIAILTALAICAQLVLWYKLGK